MNTRVATAAPRFAGFALAVGPGLMVMLADTDAGSVITAAQSGMRWGYQLLVLQLLILPLLFIVQELTIRLALGTGKGYATLIRERFGRSWALLATGTLALSCLGALVTQLSGLVGVGQLFGIPAVTTVIVTITLIFTMVITGSYHAVERIAIFLGLFEIAFFVVAWKAAPNGHEVLAQMRHMPMSDPNYLYLLAANLGTSVMPWTVIYQQYAIVN